MVSMTSRDNNKTHRRHCSRRFCAEAGGRRRTIMPPVVGFLLLIEFVAVAHCLSVQATRYSSSSSNSIATSSSSLLAASSTATTLLSEPTPTSTTSTWSRTAWSDVLSDLPFETVEPRSLRIEGTIPPDLNGRFYKAGPAKFSHGGQQYNHWLEGDGAVFMLDISGGHESSRDGDKQDEGGEGTLPPPSSSPSSSATFVCRFVQTESYINDQIAGRTTVRGTFGTPKAVGINAFDTKLKQPCNTNAIRLGDYVLALSEVGLPYRLDPDTLETLDVETSIMGYSNINKKKEYKVGNAAATVGVPFVDDLLGFGHAMVAHTRTQTQSRSDDGNGATMDSNETTRDNSSKTTTMIAVKQHAITGDSIVDILQRDTRSGRVVNCLEGIKLVDSGFVPHDFAITSSRFIWLTCPAGGNLIPYILGQKGPAECLSFRQGATSTIHVVSTSSRSSNSESFQESSSMSSSLSSYHHVERIPLPEPIHVVHFGCAYDAPDGGFVMYLSGWDSQTIQTMMDRQNPLLGSWSAILQGDFSDVPFQPLLKVSCCGRGNTTTVPKVETIMQDSIKHIDFLKCHPDFESLRVRYLFGAVAGKSPSKSNPAGIGPPQSICIVDLYEEQVVDSWFAGNDNILDDFILVPKRTTKDKKDGYDDERRAWIIAPCFIGETKTTAFVILDASNLASGPVATLYLDDHHIPWGLHGSWWDH